MILDINLKGTTGGDREWWGVGECEGSVIVVMGYGRTYQWGMSNVGGIQGDSTGLNTCARFA